MFHIEGIPGDRQGPKLESRKMIELTEDELRLLRTLYEHRYSQIDVMGETLAISANVNDYNTAAQILVDHGYATSHSDIEGDEYLDITQKGVRKVQEE
jgi:hypothetical protein